MSFIRLRDQGWTLGWRSAARGGGRWWTVEAVKRAGPRLSTETANLAEAFQELERICTEAGLLGP